MGDVECDSLYRYYEYSNYINYMNAFNQIENSFTYMQEWESEYIYDATLGLKDGQSDKDGSIAEIPEEKEHSKRRIPFIINPPRLLPFFQPKKEGVIDINHNKKEISRPIDVVAEQHREKENSR